MVRAMTVEPGQPDGALTITYRGLTVVLTVSPPAAGTEAVTEADVLEALESAPPATIRLPQVREAVRHASGAPTAVGDVEAAVECSVVVARSGMAAYAIPPAPPAVPAPRRPRPSRAAAELVDEADEGEEAEPDTDPGSVSEAWLRTRLEELGVTHGILDDVVREFEPARVLESVCGIARGQSPRKGRDAGVTLTFDPETQHEPAAREDGGVDFRTTLAEQFVEADTVLARRQPPVEGTEGEDVFGQAVAPPRVQDRLLEQMAGPNTEVRGEELVAVETGQPVLAGQRISVLQVIEVPGDLDYSVGNIGFRGDVVVRGDVLPGFTIEASGSVSVSGVTEGASIQAGQGLTLGGVVGGHDTVLKAGGDLVARFLHNANIEVDGEVRVQGEVVNCQIRAQRVVTDPKGRIVGGTVSAVHEVDTGTLGSLEEVTTQISVQGDGSGVIRARRMAYPGVNVHVEHAVLQLAEEVPGASFWDVAGTIVKLSASADAQEPEKLRAESANLDPPPAEDTADAPAA